MIEAGHAENFLHHARKALVDLDMEIVPIDIPSDIYRFL